MRSLFRCLIMVPFFFLPVHTLQADTIDGRVTQFLFPREDISLVYVEAKSCFTVQLRGKTAMMEGQKFYIGDGKIAIELMAHPTQGIFLQEKLFEQTQIKKDSTIQVRPGYKKATDLTAGDIYVVLDGIKFELPKK